MGSVDALTADDYSACARCVHLGYFGNDHTLDYCSRDYPDPDKISPMSHHRYMLGCSLFSWNGMPINREAFAEVSQLEEYQESPLRILPHQEVLCDLTFAEITLNNRYGSSFDKTKLPL